MLFRNTNQKGFTLYVAIVISAVSLLGAYGISTSIINQQIFSTDYENSQKAFAIAEAGILCAEFYDITFDAFNVDDVFGEVIECGDVNMKNGDTLISINESAKIGGTGVSEKSQFELRLGSGCAYVTVNKNPATQGVITEIESRGFNVCEPIAGSRRIQRGISVEY